MDMQPPMAQPGQDPDQASEGTEADQGQGGYEICIKVAADGSLSVGVESAADEAAEAQGGTDDDSGYKPAKDIKDALTQALEIYKNNGEAPGGDEDESEFAGGFANRGGSSPAY